MLNSERCHWRARDPSSPDLHPCGPGKLVRGRRHWRTHDLSLCVGDLDLECSTGVLTTPWSGSRPRGQRRRARDTGLTWGRCW
jgi:hypothetical protein